MKPAEKAERDFRDLLKITEKDRKIMLEELKKKASEVNPMLSWHIENTYYGQVGK